MPITWGEFKKTVEERGATDEMEIIYIDTTGYEFFDVHIENGKLTID